MTTNSTRDGENVGCSLLHVVAQQMVAVLDYRLVNRVLDAAFDGQLKMKDFLLMLCLMLARRLFALHCDPSH